MAAGEGPVAALAETGAQPLRRGAQTEAAINQRSGLLLLTGFRMG